GVLWRGGLGHGCRRLADCAGGGALCHCWHQSGLSHPAAPVGRRFSRLDALDRDFYRHFLSAARLVLAPCGLIVMVPLTWHHSIASPPALSFSWLKPARSVAPPSARASLRPRSAAVSPILRPASAWCALIARPTG